MEGVLDSVVEIVPPDKGVSDIVLEVGSSTEVVLDIALEVESLVEDVQLTEITVKYITLNDAKARYF